MRHLNQIQSGRNRRRLTLTGIAVLLALCGAGALGLGLLKRIFPVTFSPPDLEIGQPLGASDALAFSVMRVYSLRPFSLYTLDGAHGLTPLSEGPTGSDVQPAWSPDGAQLAYLSVYGWSTRLFLVDAEGGNRREITADDTYKALLRWSPDGARLAYLAFPQVADGSPTSAADLCVFEISTGVTHQSPAGNVQDLVWAPDGPALLALVRDGDQVTLERYDADGSHERRVAQADFLREAFTISLSPGASQVAYFTPGPDPDSEFLNISAMDGTSTTSVRARPTEGSLAWSPDSTKIAFAGLTAEYDYALYVMDAGRAELRELLPVNPGDESGEIVPANPAWSPDGTRLAIASYATPDGAAVFVLNADGTERRQILATTGTGSMIYDLAWRPDK